MAIIEDEKIGLEYEIINDVISIRRVYVKDNVKVEEVEDKPLTSYEYVSGVMGATLRYSDFKHDEFTLKIRGEDIPTLEVQRLVVLVSEDYVGTVELLKDNTGLHVYLDNFLAEGECFNKEFFDNFSKEVLCTLVDVQDDGLVKFCAEITYMSKDETPDRFKHLINCIDKALI